MGGAGGGGNPKPSSPSENISHCTLTPTNQRKLVIHHTGLHHSIMPTLWPASELSTAWRELGRIIREKKAVIHRDWLKNIIKMGDIVLALTLRIGCVISGFVC